ncbi:type VI secretion system tube protein TssD [Aquella oligotrophica]|uniref:Type VI secretion system tube protein Hcp n=1 Tax=Aquella oligotrophica TaxID=2067065 RepID=A0A2I7N9C6_9NEIS|nr:type VI secretion system tube protein TssD [Aquella oligotrophica]AUR53064.1 type VI secretion system tube protein Hcp [Aquella oligotrophica]
MAITIYATIQGSSQGAIQGDVKQQGRENTILGYALDHDVEIPRDTHTGLAVGQRIHNPVVLTTEIGKHTPKIFQACSTGEPLDVTLDFYRINDKGLEEKYYTVKLTKAIVVNSREWFPETFIADNKPYKHMQTISMSYEKISWIDNINSTEAEDAWNAPKLA